MADGCNYIGKFECSVCQGVENHTDFCVLNCGHPFHVLCVETWLERSATCPSCRAKVTRRNIRPLAGVESVPDAPPGDEAFQQRLAHAQEQVEALEQQLSGKEEVVATLSAATMELGERQQRLQAKLADARAKLSSLEVAQLAEQQRVSQLTADKQKLLEKYKTDLALLQHALKDEQQRQRQATAELRRLQLSNPRLDAASIQAIAGLDGQQQQQPQSAAALAGALAQRNGQLQEARSSLEQLHQQLAQQQEAAAQQLEAAAVQQAAEKVALQQQQQQHMRDALHLEYENSKLKQQTGQLEHQLQELRGVLLALEGGGKAAAAGALSSRQAPASGRHQHQQQHRRSSMQQQQQQENVPPKQQQQQQQQPLGLVQPHSNKGSKLRGQPIVLQATCASHIHAAGGGVDLCTRVAKRCSSSGAVKLLDESVDGDDAGDEGGDGDGWMLPSSQPVASAGAGTAAAASPHNSSSSQLLDELLGEMLLPTKQQPEQQPEQQTQPQQQPLEPTHPVQKVEVQEQQQQQQQQEEPPDGLPAAVSPPGASFAVGLGAAGILLPGLQQVPSFMSRGKVAAPGGAVTGQLLRSGPDGKGGTALHVKSSNKRVSLAASAPTASKKQRFAAFAAGGCVKVQGGSSKAGQTGIAAFLCRR